LESARRMAADPVQRLYPDSRARAAQEGGRLNSIVSDIRISPLTQDQKAAAARMLARAFVTNPLHLAVFGADQLAANEAFFRIGLDVMKGPKMVAVDGSRIVGIIHWVPSPGCQFSTAEKLRMTPAMVKGFGLRSAWRVGSWLSIWSKHDPAEPHLHLGPIGVDPEAQGRHIGQQLMARYCSELDRAAVVGYLETDRPGNVDFYKRFGFRVTAATLVWGVTNHFMRRECKPR
jgi:ribosomal protein S18 acetylase RimI-like enzyme